MELALKVTVRDPTVTLFAPLLVMVAVIATSAWRLTGSYVPGALVNALWVSWYIVAGQATQAV